MRGAHVWTAQVALLTAASGCERLTTADAAPEYLRAVAISAGWNHTCALDMDGAAWCWGAGRNGELGVDTTTLGPTRVSHVPVRVSGDMRFTAIAAGEGFTCALTSNGSAYCWGTNKGLSLGSATTGGACTSPCSVVPVPVIGGHQFTRLFVNALACGLEASGDLYCWGGGQGSVLFGSLLMGIDSSATPVRITAEDGSNPAWESVAAGPAHACAATAARRVACWGSNTFAALGIGDTVPAFVERPRFVASTTPLHAAGVFLFGGCALDDDGHAMCWGYNATSMLGTGSATHQACRFPNTDCSPEPVAVASSRAFVSLTVGFGTVCGLTADGTAWCWGDVPGPDNLLTRVSTPTRLSASVQFSSLSFLNSHQCGLGTDGFAYCWGYNHLGQSGVEGRGYLSIPTRIRKPTAP